MQDSRRKISVSWQTVSRTYAKTYFVLAPAHPETPCAKPTLESPLGFFMQFGSMKKRPANLAGLKVRTRKCAVSSYPCTR
jgi:hypothetical protein